MIYSIDTNVIFELRKGAHCDASVAAGWSKVNEDDLWLSALVIGEIRRGIELARKRDPQKALALETWLQKIVTGFDDRILPVDMKVAQEWGRLNAIRPPFLLLTRSWLPLHTQMILPSSRETERMWQVSASISLTRLKHRPIPLINPGFTTDSKIKTRLLTAERRWGVI